MTAIRPARWRLLQKERRQLRRMAFQAKKLRSQGYRIRHVVQALNLETEDDVRELLKGYFTHVVLIPETIGHLASRFASFSHCAPATLFSLLAGPVLALRFVSFSHCATTATSTLQVSQGLALRFVSFGHFRQPATNPFSRITFRFFALWTVKNRRGPKPRGGPKRNGQAMHLRA